MDGPGARIRTKGPLPPAQGPLTRPQTRQSWE
jgi:hypothetical protein